MGGENGSENGDNLHADLGFPNGEIAHQYGGNSFKLHIDELNGLVQGVECACPFADHKSVDLCGLFADVSEVYNPIFDEAIGAMDTKGQIYGSAELAIGIIAF